MDFLTLFAVYVAVVLACIALVCKHSGRQQTPLGVLLGSVGKVSAAPGHCTSTGGRAAALFNALATLVPGGRANNAAMAPKVQPEDPAPAVPPTVRDPRFPGNAPPGRRRRRHVRRLMLCF